MQSIVAESDAAPLRQQEQRVVAEEGLPEATCPHGARASSWRAIVADLEGKGTDPASGAGSLQLASPEGMLPGMRNDSVGWLEVVGTSLLALGLASVGCTKQMPPEQVCEQSCVSDGACTPASNGCIADSDSDCQQASVCSREGRCTAKKGVCIAGKDEDCAGAEVCKNGGECTARAGVCVVGDEAPAEPAAE